ncbi:hypothetical protein IW140_000094 [Coemansia sp. RSA 1813]|nr:hypothetical protein EV178_000103 [Coemansia sp. RSA 1646]KAJ1771481.1 hypothetical protein LPJ74_002301 [Coemansia sp. RSA 1843]KAJ2093198.1 hypothetical protein IW138_000491 [Coemansia sp. RSA 986]KAJ2217537.1 hypothetical protein EV179_000371 [Coemansia sp. RSA 487]KAJ2573452.1 hypothetical protein IW140_000094 [Coemansia sp. RSA 1813]
MSPRNSRPLKRQRAPTVGKEHEHRNRRHRGGQRHREADNVRTGPANSSDTPRVLPGFLWDEDKQRYFPATSRAADYQVKQQEERERARVQAISEAQQRENERRIQQNKDWAVPMALRRLSTHPDTTHTSRSRGTRRTEMNRLRFAPVGSYRRSIDIGYQPSAITSLCVFPAERKYTECDAGRIVVVGRRSGELNVVEIDSDHNVSVRYNFDLQSEVTSIHHISEERYIYAYMGDANGGCVAIAGAGFERISAFTFPSSTVYCASKLPSTLGASRVATAVGLEGSTATMAVLPTGLLKVFNAKTGSDILSTAFIGESSDVFVGGGRDGRIRLFDCRVNGKRHNQQRGMLTAKSAGCKHESSVHGIGSDGWLVISTSMDGHSRVWDLRMPSETYFTLTDQQMAKHGPEAVSLSGLRGPPGMLASRRLGFDVRNGVAAIADSDNHVRVWDVRRAERLQTLAFPVSNGSCGAVCLDWGSLASHPWIFVGQLNEIVACSNTAML